MLQASFYAPTDEGGGSTCGGDGEENSPNSGGGGAAGHRPQQQMRLPLRSAGTAGAGAGEASPLPPSTPVPLDSPPRRNAASNVSSSFHSGRAGSNRMRRSNSPVCRRRENRLTRISLSIVWLFLFCHVWKLVPTAYELAVGAIEDGPWWLGMVQDVSHGLIVLNSSVNFLIYVAL